MAMLVYVWSRRSPHVRVNFFGLLNFQAPFLPWALMGFSLLLGNSVVTDLLGEPAHPPTFATPPPGQLLPSGSAAHTSLPLLLPTPSSYPNLLSLINAPQAIQLAHRICICS